jgi:hypothetical protein
MAVIDLPVHSNGDDTTEGDTPPVTADPPTLAHRRDIQRFEAESIRLVARARQAEDAFERFKDHATEVLHREGDTRGYCSELDDVLEEIGLPRRTRDYQVLVETTISVPVVINARNEEHAGEQIRDFKIWQALRDAVTMGHVFAIDQFDVVEVEVDE